MAEVPVDELKERLAQMQQQGLNPRQMVMSAHAAGDIDTKTRRELLIWCAEQESVA